MLLRSIYRRAARGWSWSNVMSHKEDSLQYTEVRTFSGECKMYSQKFMTIQSGDVAVGTIWGVQERL